MIDLTVALGILGALGTLGTFYFGRRSLELDRKRRSLNWTQVQAGATQILRDELTRFCPDAILCTAGPGAGVASIAISELRAFLPMYLMMYEDLGGTLFKDPPENYGTVESSRWRIHIPDNVLNNPTQRLLVFTDCVISGNTSSVVRTFLQDSGYQPQNIRYVALVCSQIARDSNRAPDAYWYLNPHSDFYFPWGKWY